MDVMAWRHPKPLAMAGRCIGRTDVPVDRRKAKRLAHRIRQWARRHRAPHVVVTSPLQRAACVGRCLAGWGWRHRVDGRLIELDFGRWDGQAWDEIGADAVEAWCADFMQHAPGGGESVRELLRRCREFLDGQAGTDAAVCVVGHAGWISAGLWLVASPTAAPTPADWPPSVAYGRLVALSTGASQAAVHEARDEPPDARR